MLTTIAIVLIVLWLLGLTAHVAGGLIHILLVIAVVLILLRLIRGQSVI
ncbi:lmo0937 family membrane protein [Patescibacteria group bacterium]|nr:lmo0937 family membrane protein [Patescibacteria group bacterium]